MSDRYIFPKWSNYIPTIALVAVVGLLSLVVFVFWYWFSPKNLNVGYEPKQPIPFSHAKHAGDLGIDCRYCHYTVEKAGHAAIPPTDVCMNCHTQVKKDSPLIAKVRESAATGEPIEWVKVHNLPDYVYFDHSRHVNSGVSCVSCHGRVDTMEVVRQVQPLSMSWCLECHRDPAKFVRPKDKVTDLGWTPENQEAMGKALVSEYHLAPREDCNTCHR